MNALLSILLFQYTIAATAGLVSQVRGPVNVQRADVVSAGKSVETGPQGFAELQLSPGNYLRLRENSSIVFDSVVLSDIRIRITGGSALIETNRVDPDMPIRVTAGSLSSLIRNPGLYKFSEDEGKVFNGQLDLDNGTRIRKGYEAKAADGGFDVNRLDDEEILKPYAPDKIKVFVQAKQGDVHMKFMNSIFAEMCRHELQGSRDIQVVPRLEQANYVLIASGGRQISYRRVFAHADLQEQTDGKVVFSNSETRPEYDDIFLQPSHKAVHALIQELLRKMHWR